MQTWVTKGSKKSIRGKRSSDFYMNPGCIEHQCPTTMCCFCCGGQQSSHYLFKTSTQYLQEVTTGIKLVNIWQRSVCPCETLWSSAYQVGKCCKFQPVFQMMQSLTHQINCCRLRNKSLVVWFVTLRDHLRFNVEPFQESKSRFCFVVFYGVFLFFNSVDYKLLPRVVWRGILSHLSIQCKKQALPNPQLTSFGTGSATVLKIMTVFALFLFFIPIVCALCFFSVSF